MPMAHIAVVAVLCCAARAGLGWAGLGWAGLGWAGLRCAALCCAVLGSAVLCWAGLCIAGQGCAVQCCAAPRCAVLCTVGYVWLVRIFILCGRCGHCHILCSLFCSAMNDVATYFINLLHKYISL